MKNKLLVMVLIFCLLCSVGCNHKEIESSDNKESRTEKVVTNPIMGLGWNLGNSLDTLDANHERSITEVETLWGNPVTTQEMIDTVADAGFSAVRVPITYVNHADEDGTIDEKWLDRVEEVVNYVLDAGMYCIIDVHHDVGKGAVINADNENYAYSKKLLESYWTQISNKFKDYDDHLIFEGFNEILNSNNEWDYAGTDSYYNTNKLNQVFVDTVRRSGGNNRDRYLITNLYAAVPSETGIENFKLPEDVVEDRLIVGFHSYETDKSKLKDSFRMMKKAFIDQGIPVILGEFGMQATGEKNNLEDRMDYCKSVVQLSAECGIPCFWWDNGNKFDNKKEINNYALLDRYKNEWFFPEIVQTMMDTWEENN